MNDTARPELELLAQAIHAIHDALRDITPSAELAPPLDSHTDLVELYAEMLALRVFGLALAKGDLSQQLQVKGQFAGALKALQANLRHLTWQTQMIAQGDFSQRVHFMGEFATAFNTMVEHLDRARQELVESERRYRLLAENATDVIWIMDVTGKYTYVSPSVERLRGYTPEEVLQQSLDEAVCPGSINIVRDGLQFFIDEIKGGRRRTPRPVFIEQPCKDGSTVWTEVIARVIYDQANQPIGILGATRDITERRKLEVENQRRTEELAILYRIGNRVAASLALDQLSLALYEEIKHIMPVEAFYVAVYDNETDLISFPFIVEGMNEQGPVFGKMEPRDLKTQPGLTGYIIQSQKTLYVPDLAEPPTVLPVQAIPLSQKLSRTYLGVPFFLRGQVIGILSMQTFLPNSYTADLIRLAETIATELAFAVDNARLYEKAQRLAITDTLTGLYNRRHFYALALNEIERARRYRRSLAVIMLDLDKFKHINDTYGHPAGDKVLQALARLCHKQLRTVDIVGRYGGEEFIALLPETARHGAVIAAERIQNGVCATVADAYNAAERLREQINQVRVETEQGTIYFSASIGIADLETILAQSNDLTSATCLERLLACADSALYLAKRKGGNRVEVYSEDNPGTAKEHQIDAPTH